MRKCALQLKPVLVAALCLVAVGCGPLGALQAKRALRDANTLYSSQDYRAAAAKYEEAIAEDPDLTAAYFFLGNSYHNLYRPALRGESANDELLTKAVQNYKKALAMEQDLKIRRMALEHLVAAHGPDKLNDAAQQESFVQQLITLDPKEPTNYFVLAKIHEERGDYDAAEKALLKAKEARPNEPSVYTQLAAFYNGQGDFEKTMAALHERAEREPNNPEAHHLIATYYWDKVYRDFRLGEAQKRKYIAAGLQSADRAIQLNNQYFEAIAYKNLLLRLQANVEKDPVRQQTLLREADRLRDQAEGLRKKREGSAAGE